MFIQWLLCDSLAAMCWGCRARVLQGGPSLLDTEGGAQIHVASLSSPCLCMCMCYIHVDTWLRNQVSITFQVTNCKLMASFRGSVCLCSKNGKSGP